MDLIISENWGLALQTILKSYTTDVIYSSMSHWRQIEFINHMLTLRSRVGPEQYKYFDEPLSKRPFALITIYVLLAEERLYPVSDVRTFIDRAHLDITEFEYAHFKYSPFSPALTQRI